MDKQLELWTDGVRANQENEKPEPAHVVQPGGMKHRGDCPACQAAFDAGASWTSLPWSETYWAS